MYLKPRGEVECSTAGDRFLQRFLAVRDFVMGGEGTLIDANDR